MLTINTFHNPLLNNTINIVQCPNCSHVLYHEVGYSGKLKCNACKTEDKICFFPDYFY